LAEKGGPKKGLFSVFLETYVYSLPKPLKIYPPKTPLIDKKGAFLAFFPLYRGRAYTYKTPPPNAVNQVKVGFLPIFIV